MFLTRVLEPLTRALPRLRIVLEHISTREAVQFVLDAGENVVATVTAHHLLLNRNGRRLAMYAVAYRSIRAQLCFMADCGHMRTVFLSSSTRTIAALC